MATRTIMIVGAGEEHCLGIQTARARGLDVFVTDANPLAPGLALADDHAIVSTYDAAGTLRAARNHIRCGGRIDGVMTLAADVPATVAHVAAGLGLPGITPESAALASDKLRMKQAFAHANVPGPAFVAVQNEAELARAADALGLPVVVKPADNRGARGVQRVTDRSRLPQAFRQAHAVSPTGRVLAEAYLAGPQLSAEGCMLGGTAHIPAIFDRNYEHLERFAPFVVEDGGEMPSVHAATVRSAVHDVMREAALALGITTGIVKGDLVIHEGQVKVIEIAARLSGGFFATVATPASCGVDLVAANLALALGEPLDPAALQPRHDRGAAIRFAFPPCGRLRRVSGLERVRADPACRFAHVFAAAGDELAPITSHPARPAVVVADGADREDAVRHAQRLIATLVWEVGHGA